MTETKFIIKAYGLAELARKYDVCRTTFIRWISKIKDLNITPNSKILTPSQVQKIVDHLGEP